MTGENAKKGFIGNLCPVTEIFAAIDTHSERAKWLLSVPLEVILRDHLALVVICRRAGFRLGEAYVTAELTALSAIRVGGEVRIWHSDMVRTIRAMMREEAGYPRRKLVFKWKFW